MFAHIVGRKVRQGRGEMAFGRFLDERPGRWWRGVGEMAPAPGAAEIEPVEMGDLAVAAVADPGRGVQGVRLALVEIRQKGLEPQR